MSTTPTGHLVRAARLRAKLSREQLGAAIRSNKVTVWRIETGATKSPKVSTLAAIAHALGVPLEELLAMPRRGKGARG